MCENSDIGNVFVSVVVPIKNEEKYIKKFLNCLKEQTYSQQEMEIILCDGNSTDNTLFYIDEFKKNNNNLKITVLNNNRENAPSGVNLGIKNSKGEIIVRLDAHTYYPKEYIEKNVYYLLNNDADNVGCPVDTVGESIVGRSIAHICSCKFGVGNSKFRTTNFKGYVDTVPFGCFRKTLMEKIGYFDENLPRSEDNDFNYRIRKNGGKVLMFNEISTLYHSRSSILSFCKMAFNNGKGVVDLFKKNKEAIGVRHFIPFLFLIGNLLGLTFVFLNISILNLLYLITICFYLILDLFFSFFNNSELSIYERLICLILFPLFHLCYGFGSLVSILERR